MMQLFNNTLSPYIIFALISANCFYNVFFDPDLVKSDYSYYIREGRSTKEFGRLFGVLPTLQNRTITYVPPYQVPEHCP